MNLKSLVEKTFRRQSGKKSFSHYIGWRQSPQKTHHLQEGWYGDAMNVTAENPPAKSQRLLLRHFHDCHCPSPRSRSSKSQSSSSLGIVTIKIKVIIIHLEQFSLSILKWSQGAQAIRKPKGISFAQQIYFPPKQVQEIYFPLKQVQEIYFPPKQVQEIYFSPELSAWWIGTAFPSLKVWEMLFLHLHL